MPSDTILSLASSGTTVTKAVANNPTEEIANIAHKLYSDKRALGAGATRKESKKSKGHGDYTHDDLDRAAKCGKFPYRPSDLFLKASTLLVVDLLRRDRRPDILRCFGHPRARSIVRDGVSSFTGVVGHHSPFNRLSVHNVSVFVNLGADLHIQESRTS